MTSRRLFGPGSALIASVVALTAGACSAQSTARSSATVSPTVQVSVTASPSTTASSTAVTGKATVLHVATVSLASGGKTSVLVTSSGLTVYLLSGDGAQDPKCTSAACTSFWTPVTSSTSTPQVGTGVTGTVSVWHHNGIDQQTIDGHPLYTFGGDTAAGSSHGNGLASYGGTWKAVTPAGSAVN